jgi:hypothetical protein
MTATEPSAHLAEYEKLKEEQGRRIHFRDNMRYIMFVAAGFVFSKAGDMPYALLAIPWMCSVLGWTYVANMRQVCRIREYVKTRLADKVGDDSFGWEHEAPQNDYRRRLLVDEITFVGPGLVALIAFVILAGGEAGPAWLLVAVEAVFLLWIGWEVGHPRASKRLPLKRPPRAVAPAGLEAASAGRPRPMSRAMLPRGAT